MKSPFLSHTRLFHLSRDPGVLWRIVIGILVLSLISAGILGSVVRRPPLPQLVVALMTADPAMRQATVQQFLREAGIKDILTGLSILAEAAAPETEQAHPEDSGSRHSLIWQDMPLQFDLPRQIAQNPNLTADDRELILAIWQSLSINKPAPELEALAAREPPVRYAAEMLAKMLETSDPDRALQLYQREGRFPEAQSARAGAIRLLMELKRDAEVRQLMREPNYADAVSLRTALEWAAAEGLWWEMVRSVLRHEFIGISLLTGLIVGLSGAIWFTLLLQMGQAPAISGRAALCLAAVVLGALSTVPVLIAGFLQEHYRNFTPTGDFTGGLLYFVVGVGVREELLKLLFLVPLVPFLMRRNDRLEMLIVSAAVGLGFAIAENLSYVERGGTADTIGRFLTANFFHMSLTGILGLALCEGIAFPRGGIERFLTKLVVVILVHGIYDFLIINPVIRSQGLSFLSITVFVWLAYQFFHELRQARMPAREPISLLATFSISTAVLVGASFNVAAMQLGFQLGISSVMLAAVTVGVLNVLYVREMGTL